MVLIGRKLATVIRKGSNNAMLFGSAAYFGEQRTFPHILGILLGFGFMTLCVGVFFSRILQQRQVLRETRRRAGVSPLIYVASRTSTKHWFGLHSTANQPFTSRISGFANS